MSQNIKSVSLESEITSLGKGQRSTTSPVHGSLDTKRATLDSHQSSKRATADSTQLSKKVLLGSLRSSQQSALLTHPPLKRASAGESSVEKTSSERSVKRGVASESSNSKTCEEEEVEEGEKVQEEEEVVCEVEGWRPEQVTRERSHMSDEEVGLARGFFSTFLMKLDVDYYNTALCGVKPHEPSVLSAFLETGPPICHVEKGWKPGVRPYLLDEDWEYLDEMQDEEKQMLIASWRPIRRKIHSIGRDIFIVFFKANPEYRGLFTQLQKLKQEDLLSSAQLSAHGHAVMKAIDRIISNLKKPAACMRVIHEIGVNHKKHLLDVDHFKKFKDAFVEVLKGEMKENFSPRIEKVWVKFLTIILAIMEDTVKMDMYGRTRKIDEMPT